MHAAEATSVGSPPSGAANQLRGGLNDLLGLPSPRCTPVSVRPPPILGSAGNDAPGEGEEGESSPQEPLDSGEGDADSSTSHEFTMELIGRGACGCVYKSIWDGQTVAIKVGLEVEHRLLALIPCCAYLTGKVLSCDRRSLSMRTKHCWKHTRTEAQPARPT